MRLAKNESDARPPARHSASAAARRIALRKLSQKPDGASGVLSHKVLWECEASSHRFPSLNPCTTVQAHTLFAIDRREKRSGTSYPLPASAVVSPIASLPRLFRGALRSAGSGEAVAGIFAGSNGGFCAYPASTPARVVLLPQSSLAGRFPPVEALHSGPATPECDSLPLAVALKSHCSLLPLPLADVGLLTAGFDMQRSLRLARRSMCWPFADHNESVLEFPLAVRRSKLLTFLISS